jgi:hypothetical protein
MEMRVFIVRNETPFVLCLIAGMILITVNYTRGVDIIVLVYLLVHSIAALSPFYLVIDIVLFILFLIAWSGGFAVILGGALLTTSHVRMGRWIVAIAAGFGLISLILYILWTYLAFGLLGLLVFTSLVLSTAWAMALIMTVVARQMAK